MLFETVDAAGVGIEVMRTDSRSPDLVLLPELFGGVRGYAPLCDHLAGLGVSVAAVNPRSCGASTGSLDGLTMDVLADDVARVLEAIDAAPVYLAGHALGNRLARLLATRLPQRVEGVVLMAAGGRVRGSLMAYFWLLRAAQPRLDPKARIKAWNRFMFAPGNDAPTQLRDWSDRSHALARATIQAQKQMSTAAWWAGGTAPMLVLQGQKDRIAPVKNGHELQKQWPARVEVIDLPGAGHALPFEQPERIANEIDSWIRRTAARQTESSDPSRSRTES